LLRDNAGDNILQISICLCGLSPQTSTATEAEPAPNTSGWQAERELGPQPGIDLIDRMVTAADKHNNRTPCRPWLQMLTVQSQQIAALAALVLRNDKPKKAEAKR
jgi:hypothetical protein